MMDFKSRRLSLYSSAFYVMVFGVSIGITWLSLDTFVAARQLDMKIAGLVAAVVGVALSLACVLAFWILVTEVIGFEIREDGAILLQRLWMKPLAHVTEVRLLIKLGCVLRADGAKGECVPYVILRADQEVVPMPAEIYSRLGASLR